MFADPGASAHFIGNSEEVRTLWLTEPIISNAAALTGWRKSSYSDSEGGNCLEILDDHPVGIPVRDSKIPEGPAWVLPSTGWALFVTTVEVGNVTV
ncbi:DUF397 domain-containing protein [Streptomyces nigra]|uniref:DUF397 domain-containing protein n=1 Tax=Streptomyces nigra TaxID=1827580 RepID=UPI003808970B